MKNLLICLFTFQFVFAAQENADSNNFSKIISTGDLSQIENFIIEKKNQTKFDEINNGFNYLILTLIPNQLDTSNYMGIPPWVMLYSMPEIMNKFEQIPELWTKIATLFTTHGIDVNYKNSKGETALMLAAQKNSLNGIALLISFGANINLENNEGKTALFIAAEYKQATALDAVFYLLIHDASLGSYEFDPEEKDWEEPCYDWDGTECWSITHECLKTIVNKSIKWAMRKVTEYKRERKKICYENIVSLPNDLVNVINEY